MFDKGEEAESAILNPLENDATIILHDFSLDEGREFPNGINDVPSLQKGAAVCFPGSKNRLAGIVEQIDIMGHPGGSQQFVQSRAAGYISFAFRDSLRRQYAAHAALEIG
jgi:hypothetical protein